MRPETSNAARIAAPLAFLLAATVLVLLVRSALDSGEPAALTETAPAETQPAEAQEPEQPEEPEQPAQPPPQQEQPAQQEQPPAQPPAEEEPPQAAYHVIQSGDTLEAIASQYGTSVEQLMELNPGIDPIALTVGQRIRVS